MRRLHTEWRCPSCHATRTTLPRPDAFCTRDDCMFTAMEPHKPDATDATLAYPHLTPEQRRLDREMRENRGVAGC